MIIQKNIRQPFGPTLAGVVTKNVNPYGPSYAGIVIKRPQGFQGVIVNNRARVFNRLSGLDGVIVNNAAQPRYRGYGDDFDANAALQAAINNTGGILNAAGGLFTTLSGGNKTGTGTVANNTNSGAITNNTGYTGAAYAASTSFFSSIPTGVWIAAGALVLGGAVILLMK